VIVMPDEGTTSKAERTAAKREGQIISTGGAKNIETSFIVQGACVPSASFCSRNS